MSTLDGKFWQKAWNPLHVKGGGWHCTKISPGCRSCWAEAMNMRFGNGTPFNCLMYPVGFELDHRILEQPLHWKKPRVIATQWLGDLFHEQIPDGLIATVFGMPKLCPQHKFLFLTKRIERLVKWHSTEFFWPLPNVWLGISVCTQKEADEKIPILLQTPAAHRYINLEPCLEEINLEKQLGNPNESMVNGWYGIDWVLVGTESGPGRRPMKLEWARSIAEQCKAAGIPRWIKQLELEDWAKSVYKAKTKVSKDMNEWPEDQRIRQWPW